MTDELTAAFNQVRAIVDRRMANRKARKALRGTLSSPVTPHAAADLVIAEACCECPSPRQLPNPRKARLPDNLPVPPVESRPPNLHAANLSFAARIVIAIRDKFNGEAPKIYSAARISRQAYSQIVSDETRPVSKRTAIRFAFALKSTPEEARLLLKSAGYAFSNSLTEDFILQACLEVNPPIWNLDAVNDLLREYRVDYQY